MGKFLVQNQELLSVSDIQAILNRAKRPLDRALIVLLWIFGCRISEAIVVKREDIYVGEEKVTLKVPILKKRDTAVKSEHSLKVPKSTPFIDILINYIEKVPQEEYIFPGYKKEKNDEKGHLRRQIAWRIISKLRHGLYPHFFRHNRLNRLSESGSDANQLKNWAGWVDLRPAKNYLPRRPVEAKEII